VEPVAPHDPEPVSTANPESASTAPTLDEAIAGLDAGVSARTGNAAPSVGARPHAARLTLLTVCAAGVVAGVAFVSALGWPRGEPPVQTAAAAPMSTVPPRPKTPEITEPDPAPTWTGQPRATWAYDGSKTIAFELQAIRDVPVWMSRVRPVLVVRCLSRATEAFVVIGASVGFEEDTYLRTVRLQWDDGAEMTQRWRISESGQELFAPDGVAFVRQLVKATRLRFGFSPFNAPPVTAQFAVQGFDRYGGLVASTCGWRIG